MKETLKFLEKFYLSVTNDKTLLKTCLQKKEISSLTVAVQEKILECTVKNPIIKEYCPPISYQKFFLRVLCDSEMYSIVEFKDGMQLVPSKWLNGDKCAYPPYLSQKWIDKSIQNIEDPDSEWCSYTILRVFGEVESSCSEVCDGLIEAYANVISQSNNVDCIYRTYIIKEDCVVTLQESLCFVENSTTGLQTWEASKYLLEWCLENALLLHHKRILELGSGIGLLGIGIIKLCQPQKYLFTDKSSDVLNVLTKNIAINLEENIANDFIEKHQLLWGTVKPDDASELKADILLGADIVYDPSIIQSLVGTIKTFLSFGEIKYAYIASIIRNVDTNKYFISEIDSAGLKYEILNFYKNNIFIYNESTKFVLYKIFLTEK